MWAAIPDLILKMSFSACFQSQNKRVASEAKAKLEHILICIRFRSGTFSIDLFIQHLMIKYSVLA